MKKVLKRAAVILCAAAMMANAAGCTVTPTSTASNSAKVSNAEYNAKYLHENLGLDEFSCNYIAAKLDERGFAKIITYKSLKLNGKSTMTVGDLKQKYTITLEDNYLKDVTDEEGNVILTLDDILEAYANGTDNTNTGSGETTTDNTTPSYDVTPDTTNTNEQPTSGGTSSGYSYLTEEAKSILATVESDYNKINWGVEYSPSGMEGIVISVAPYIDNTSYYLAIAVTNLYDTDTTFSAEGSAKGQNGQEVGSFTMYDTAIAPGNTVIRLLYCDDIPTGEIHWTNIELPNVYSESAPWQGDWVLGTDADGYMKVDYNVESNTTMVPGTVTAIVLDANGNIVAAYQDYNIDKGTKTSGTITYYTDINKLSGKPTDVAMFVNPLKEN